jgi:hypothetical protein
MQKVEPKDQGCPDAPPGSPANAQQPRATFCIIHFVSSLSFTAFSLLHVSSCFLYIRHQVVHSLGAEFRSVSYSHSLQHNQRNEALD